MWGKPTWDNFIADIKVRDLELVPVKENDVPPGLDERVDLTRDILCLKKETDKYAKCTEELLKALAVLGVR